MGNSTIPPLKKRGLRYPLVGNLLHQVTFFSHLTVPFSHYAVLTSHVTVLFSHLMVLLLFFLTFDDSTLALCSSNITCDNFFLIFDDSLTFFHTFDDFILILCTSNITFDSSFFVKFSGSLISCSHLTVLFYIMQFQHHI